MQVLSSLLLYKLHPSLSGSESEESAGVCPKLREGLVDERGGGLAAASFGCLTFILPQGAGQGWGQAPLGLPPSPVPLDSPLGMASPYFGSKTGRFCISYTPEVALLSLRLKYNCRFMEQSLEMGLSEHSGCMLLRRQQELRFSAAAQELEALRTWSEGALVLPEPCCDMVNP